MKIKVGQVFVEPTKYGIGHCAIVTEITKKAIYLRTICPSNCEIEMCRKLKNNMLETTEERIHKGLIEGIKLDIYETWKNLVQIEIEKEKYETN